MTTQQRQALADLLIDLDLERRLDHDHTRPGWAPISSLELLGMPVGKGRGGAHDRETMVNRLNELRDTSLHETAKALMERVPERRQVAMLVQAAKCDSRLEGPWAVKYEDILGSLPYYLQLLGYAPGMADSLRFGSVQALKDAAKNGKKQLCSAIPRTPEEAWPPHARAVMS